MFVTKPNGIVGVQRKELKDLVNSVHDGRLGKELAQMKALGQSVLLIEGDARWTTSGASLLLNSWSRMQHNGLLLSIQSQGCFVLSSSNLSESCELLLQLKKWMEKEKHSLVRQRPGPVTKWGHADDRDWGIHLLQSFPGVGLGTATAIFDYFGRVPLAWSVDRKELQTIKGVGPKRAETLWRIFNEGT